MLNTITVTIWQVFSELVMIALYNPLGRVASHFLPSEVTASHANNGTPIIIIERWFNRNPFHSHWIEFLESSGFKVYLVSLPMQHYGWDESLQLLDEFIKTHKIKSYYLVGISAGGITAFLYATKVDKWKSCKHLVAVGTPFKGTFGAYFLSLIKSSRGLKPTSELVRKVSQVENYDEKKVTCVSARWDQFVSHKSSQLPKSNKIEVGMIGHNNLHSNCKETYEVVAKVCR